MKLIKYIRMLLLEGSDCGLTIEGKLRRSLQGPVVPMCLNWSI